MLSDSAISFLLIFISLAHTRATSAIMALGAMSDGRNLDAVALLRNFPSPKRLAVSTLLTAPMPNPLCANKLKPTHLRNLMIVNVFPFFSNWLKTHHTSIIFSISNFKSFRCVNFAFNYFANY